MTEIEVQHGVWPRRFPHNHSGFRAVRDENRVVRRQHAGLWDLFAPIGEVENLFGTLVVGPFSIGRQDSARILANYRWITGRHGRLSEPSFSRYLKMTLGTLSLDEADVPAFEALIGAFARLLRQNGPDDALVNEIDGLRSRVAVARFAERMWETAASMVDERTALIWSDPVRADWIEPLGLRRAPGHALVGLLVGKGEEADPIDDVVRRDAFQRACVEFARRRGNMACHRMGDHGVALLLDDATRGARLRAKQRDLAERLHALARRHDLEVHLGVSSTNDPAFLPSRYQSALSTAERALFRSAPLMFSDEVEKAVGTSLGELRRELLRSIERGPRKLAPSFRRYAEAAVLRASHQLEVTRAYLEAALDQLGDNLLERGLVEPAMLEAARATLENEAEQTPSVAALSEAYLRVVSDLELALENPKLSRTGRSMRRAVDYIRDHFAEPIDLDTVARIAGYAPHYFSERFAETEGTTFQDYLRGLRVERARQLLLSSELAIDHVGKLSGFSTRSTFFRAFKQRFGHSPAESRSMNP